MSIFFIAKITAKIVKTIILTIISKFSTKLEPSTALKFFIVKDFTIFLASDELKKTVLLETKVNTYTSSLEITQY